MSAEEVKTAELMSPSTMEAQSRAEYDISIATARRYPRSYDHFLKRAESLATATPEIAQAMEFAKPVGGQRVKGPSARLAEIVAATYGNLRVQARIIAVTDTEVIGQGVAHDLETNVAQSTEVRESIVDRNGKKYPPHLIATICGSVCSKARRNATFLAVPLALVEPIIAAAKKVAVGDAKTLPERRKATLDWFVAKGVKLPVIFSWLGVKAEADITLDHLADLIAAQNSAKEEGVPLAELFATQAEQKASVNRFAQAPAGEQQPGAQS